LPTWAPRAHRSLLPARRAAVLSSQTLTNTSLRQRFQLHDKQRNSITNLIADAVAAGRIKRKDSSSGNKFAEYVPYWA
jgi:predicted HTH transcriptional regulator